MHSLSTLRRVDHSTTTQDSLPVAGHALPDGLDTRRVPTKGFRDVAYIAHPPFPSFCGARCVTEWAEGVPSRRDELSLAQHEVLGFAQNIRKTSPVGALEVSFVPTGLMLCA